MEKYLKTKQEFLQVPIPQHGEKYGIIPHSVFLEELVNKIEENNYEIDREVYYGYDDNKVLLGKFRLKNNLGLDISPMIEFKNSYNKTKKAEIKIGIEVLVCQNGAIMTVGNTYSRKHLGNNALFDFRNHINNSINELELQFEKMKNSVDQMKRIGLTEENMFSLVGELYLRDILTDNQISTVKKQIQSPAYVDFDNNSLWSFYNHCTYSIEKTGHPRDYERRNIKLFALISDRFNLETANHVY